MQKIGWKDITIAIPVNVHQIIAINLLALSCSLHVIVDSPVTSGKLVDGITHPLGVWIEVDSGYHGTGVPVEDATTLIGVAKVLQRNDLH